MLVQHPSQQADHLLMCLRRQLRKLRWWGKQLALTGSGSYAHRHLLNYWKDAAPELRSIQSAPAFPIIDASTSPEPHCLHRPDSPASSDCTYRNQTSTPESPASENGSHRLVRSAEPYYHFGALRLERIHAAHATDANGTGLLENQFYGCLVPHLYNTIRPHSSLGYKSPAPETWQPEVKTGYGEVESKVRFPLPHTLDGDEILPKLVALH
jgi:hypothetical protein